MYAVITGATSGIGYEMAKILYRQYDLILVARNKQRLEEIRSSLPVETTADIMPKSVSENISAKASEHQIVVISCDVSKEEDCRRLYDKCKAYPIEILINCAGFGVYGAFLDNSLDTELEMIDTNVKGLHILTKLFLKDMVAVNRGYILNVASSAGFMPGGPKMAGYYATKAYVCNLTNSIAYELKMRKSHVYIGALCPGPVKTNFNHRAGVKNDLKGISAAYCASYGLKKMFKKRRCIIPGISIHFAYLGSKLVPDAWLLYFAGKIQSKKG